MSFMEHLEELRKTSIRVFFILLGGFVLAYTLGKEISQFLLSPLRDALVHLSDARIIYLGLLDKVISQLQVAFWTSIILSSPLWFREIWLFIRPALYPSEVKVIRPFIMAGFFLFALGVIFGHLVVFPFAFKTLLDFGITDVTASLSLKEHLLLTCKSLVFLGLVFQMPNILLILGFMGLVTKYSLRSMRRYIYVGLALVSALFTPPDIFTMLGLWLPMVILFEVGILAVALIVHSRPSQRDTHD